MIQLLGNVVFCESIGFILFLCDAAVENSSELTEGSI